MATFRYSQLRTYAQCPRKYRSQYVEGRPVPSSPALEFGSCFHKALETYHRHLIARHKANDSVGVDEAAFREALGAAFATDLSLGTEALRVGDRMIESYEVSPETIIGVEEQLEVKLDNGHTIVGHADLVRQVKSDDGDRLVLTDFKTDRALRSEAGLEADLQLRTYAWLGKQTYPQMVKVVAHMYFIRWAAPRSVEFYGDETFDRIGEQLKVLVDSIVADETYRPTPGDVCQYCAYSMNCKVPHDVGIHQARTDKQARKMADSLLVMEQQRKVMMAALKAFVAQNGPLVVNERVFEFRPPSPKIEPFTLTQILDEHDVSVPLEDLVNVDGRKVRKHVRDRQVLEAIAEASEAKGSSRFGHFKAQAEEEASNED